MSVKSGDGWSALGWSGLGVGAQALAGVVTFAVVARALGPTGFGLYAAALALAALTPTIVTVGDGALLARDVIGRGRSPRGAVLHRLRLGVYTLPFVAFAGVLAGLLVEEFRGVTAALALAALVVGEVTAFGVVELVAASFAARHRFGASTAALVGVSASRLVAVAGAVAVFGASSPIGIALALALAGVLAAVVGTLTLPTDRAIDRSAGSTHSDARPVQELREGAFVGVGRAAQRGLNDIDQTMLLRAGSTEIVGFYSAGAKLVGYAFLPLYAALRVTFPRYLAEGAAGGIEATIAYGRRVGPWYLTGGLVLSAGVIASASLVEVVLGPAFVDARPMALALAGVPLLRSAQSVLGDVLAGADRFTDRSTAVLAALAVNVVANLALIPRHGWRGAVAATYAAEVVAALVLVHLIRRCRANRPSERAIDPEVMSHG